MSNFDDVNRLLVGGAFDRARPKSEWHLGLAEYERRAILKGEPVAPPDWWLEQQRRHAPEFRWVDFWTMRECAARGHHPDETFVVSIAANGIKKVQSVCSYCGEMRRDGISHKELGVAGYRVGDLYAWRDNRNGEPCARCGAAEGTEQHHWAPKHLFPDDYHLWPTSYLCRTCHHVWHRKVTPHMHRQAS